MGLDYNFQISRKWAVGIHSDFITESFTVIDFEGNEEFERERPLTMTLVGVFKPMKDGHFWQVQDMNFLLRKIYTFLGWELKEVGNEKRLGSFHYCPT